MRRVSSLFLVVCAMSLLVPVGTVVAWAGDERPSRVVLNDTRRDVWWVPLDEDVPPSLAGRKDTVDVIRAVAAHRPRVVTVMTRVVDLRRVGSRQLFEAKIDTPSGLFIAVVQARQGDRAGRHDLYGYNAPGTVRCPGFTHDIDYGVNRVTVSVPRRCLGSPNWVRLRLDSGLFRERGGAYADNPHNDRAFAGRRGTIRLYHP